METKKINDAKRPDQENEEDEEDAEEECLEDNK